MIKHNVKFELPSARNSQLSWLHPWISVRPKCSALILITGQVSLKPDLNNLKSDVTWFWPDQIWLGLMWTEPDFTLFDLNLLEFWRKIFKNNVKLTRNMQLSWVNLGHFRLDLKQVRLNLKQVRSHQIKIESGEVRFRSNQVFYFQVRF